MARKGIRARRYQADDDSPSVIWRRVGWVALAGLWVFGVVALASFDSADWPSHMVAVHNAPTVNLCGPVGALIAYWSYYLIGVGSWIALAGLGGYLALAVAGRPLTHPLLRVVGVVFMAVAVSCFESLISPRSGPLAGSGAGLLPVLVVGELARRFSVVGTFLILGAGFGVGAVVAVDRLVVRVPGWLAAGGRLLGRLCRWTPGWLAGLWTRREVVSAVGGRSRAAARIDPDAGGVGAVEAFDPEEHELDDSLEEPAPKRLSAKDLRNKLARLPVKIAALRRPVPRDEDIPRQECFEDYEFPTLQLLEDPESNYSAKMETFVRKQAQQLEESLETYLIDGEVTGIESGPVVTLYSVQLAPGTKVAKVQAVASDIARSLRAHNIRIVPNMVGKTTVGIEVPNLYKERVRLKELMSTGHAKDMLLPMFLGKDASGDPLVADLTRMPHMLIAGTTGSGKSVCINAIIMSWLYTKRPDELKLILIDPKMVEMSQFQDIPHLMCPVVTETSKAVAIQQWAVEKMEERYELLREAAVRNVTAYNRLTEEELYERFKPANAAERAKIPKKLPYIVFIIDELADLIMTHSEVEQSIVRIAQKARAVGIHLIVATQRPQANVVTGLIKSNMPCRVSFKVASGMDSRIVLDQKGAELLLGQGDMLFLTPHNTQLKRAQGTLVTDPEIRRVATYLRGVASATFEPALLMLRPVDGAEGAMPAERDPLFDQAVREMIETGRGSVSLLQRRLAIGYTRASRLVDQMSQAGILGNHKGSVAREVLISLEEWEQMREMEEAAEASGTLFDTSSREDDSGAEVEEDEDVELEDAEDEEWEEEEYEEEEEEDDDEDAEELEEEDTPTPVVETISTKAARRRRR